MAKFQVNRSNTREVPLPGTILEKVIRKACRHTESTSTHIVRLVSVYRLYKPRNIRRFREESIDRLYQAHFQSQHTIEAITDTIQAIEAFESLEGYKLTTSDN